MLHDEVAKKLTIPFMVEDVDREAVIKRTRRGRPKLVWVPLRRATLEVENVSDYAVRDRSQIGTYTANDLLFREKTQRLIIEANEDCEIEVDLDSLGVRLEVQDEIIARVKRRYFRSSYSTWGLVEGPWPFD